MNVRVRSFVGSEKINKFCQSKGIEAKAMLAAAFALAYKSYTAAEEASFTCADQGKRYRIRLECDGKETLLSEIKRCEAFFKESLGCDEGSREDNPIGAVCLDLDGSCTGAFEGDLLLRVIKDEEGITWECEYNPASYSEYIVKGLIRTLDNVTGEFLIKDRLGEVLLTTKEDEERILNLYDASSPFEDKPGYRHLQDSAERFSDRVALIAIDRTLTYKELNEEANALGHVLREHGADIESKIAVMADRNSYGYVMREGALKSGGAFMPIDPEYPMERITYIREDSDFKLLVTTKEIMDRRPDLMEYLKAAGITVIDVTEAVKKGSKENLNIDVPGNALAYVIYTSGSTGKPKGVMIENHNLANFVDDNEHNKEQRLFTHFGQVTLAMAAFTFDVSVLEEFVPLGHGQTVVLATMDQIMDAGLMKDLILNNNVTAMTCTPTYILNLTEIEAFTPAIKNLKGIDVGAEAFPPVLYTKLSAINPDLVIYNTYGPTECTVTTTLKEVDSAEDITIGYPLSNIKLATLDKEGRLTVPGALGEMVIMGECVGRGYVGREDLNEKNFINLLGLRAYRSGDLVRIRPDGDVEFHGRIDNQVKLRGLRVELGEIESVLGNYPGVRSCIVIVAKGETDYLAAYFTADEKVDIKALKAHLSSYLTSYMVPQAFLQLDEMPMNLSGKIDKKALPEAVMMEEEIIPAENETQEKILSIVKDVIGDHPLGITSDLFAFGLSSVGCIRLCALLSEEYKKNIKVSDIVDNACVREIERLISEMEETRDYSLRELYPLSMTQTGIYIECVRFPEATTYNLPELHKLGNSVDTKKLAKAVERAVSAHPYLFMTPVKDEKGIIFAKRRDDHPFTTTIVKCDKLPPEEELIRVFSLESEEVLFRAEIYETKEGNYFFLDTHHIVSDGASLDILKRDIDRAYSGEEIEKERYTGYEFALDEEAARAGDKLKGAKAWYDSIFTGCGGETLPVKDGDSKAGHMSFEKIYGDTDGEKIRQFCEKNGITPNAFFVTAFGLALKSYTAAENAIFTTIYNGRSDTRLTDSVSMLVKTLPVYLECPPERKVLEAIEGTQSFLLSAMANDIYSFAEIRNAYDIKADILFVFQGEYDAGAMIGGEFASLQTLVSSRAMSAIAIDASFDGSKVVYEIDYDPSEYSEYTVKGLVRMMDIITGEFLSRDRLIDVRLTKKADEEKIKNLHDSDFPVKERPAYRLLQDSADKYPERKALIATDRTLTFKELNEEANALGHVLSDKGAVSDSIIAVMAERDSFAYVMRQGVLKSGGAFLPIDPEYPEERIRFILEDSGAKLLVTKKDVIEGRREMFDDIASSGVELICVEDAVKEGDKSNLNVEVPYEALAYAIYTSGSTGKPKGVMLTNKNLVNFVDDNEKNHEILGYTRRGHVSLAIAALTFDFSIMEEFVPLANGMSVVLASRDQIMNPIMLGRLMTENKVDVMSCTPSYLMNMLDMGEFTDVFTDAVAALKSVDMGAEAFPRALFDKLKEVNPDILIMNGYGPTEATISCTMQVIEDTDNITIGIPNVNVHVATLDRDGRLQGLGALGELLIMGDGVGRGYIGREDLNKKSFIKLLGLPAYRSGDLVRIRENGDIEYHGRMDNQVKLRGLRVELGEIESVMGSYPGIKSSIVIVIKKETEYLAAYFTADHEIDLDDLKAHLSERLTAYMVPQAFIQLSEMPLTVNGKIDKKALPEAVMMGEEIVPPENETQEKILSIVKDVIGDVPVGITSDLFALGLSSLGCIKLCALLSEKFEKNIKVSDVFGKATAREIEKLLGGAQEAGDYSIREIYPLSMNQAGIYVEWLRHPEATTYNISDLYKLGEGVDTKKLAKAIEKAVSAHPYLFMTPVKDEKGQVFAKRRDDHPFSTSVIKCDKLPPEDKLIRVFSLESEEVLFRAEIYETKEGNFLLLDLHHIVGDGESESILLNDIDRAYLGEEIEKEKYTGYEFALDEAKARESDKYLRAKEWYDSVFAGCGGETLPVKEPDPAAGHNGFAETIGETDADHIRVFCKDNALSINAFFVTAFGLALKAYTASEHAVFTTIYNGRSDSRLTDSVTMLVKTLPVYLECAPEKGVLEAIEDCQTFLLSAMANDIYSFAEISNAYDIRADIMLVFQGEYVHGERIGGEIAERQETGSSRAMSGISIDVSLDGSKVVYEIDYDPSQYSDYTVKGLVRMMDIITGEFLSRDRLIDVRLTKKADEEKIRNLHDSDFPVKERPAYRLLQDSADKYPDRKALIATDRTLTFKELNEEANALGHVLSDKGAKADSIIAVMAERDSFAYVMRQGVLKSGGAFLPIDPEYPEDRIRFILEDSGAKLLVTKSSIIDGRREMFDDIASSGVELICVEDAVKEGDKSDLNLDIPYEALAYAIYTSGSTGKPKGVMLTNKNLVNFVDDDEKNHEILGYTRRGHVSLAIAALTFDFSIMEEFVPLANGMSVVLATHDEIMNPIVLGKLMTENKVDVMSCTPSYLMNMLDMGEFTDVFTNAVAALKSVDMGAEAFPQALFDKLKEVNPDICIMNGYGPTEATISCTMQVIEDTDNITIGIPNVNVHVATLDREGRLQGLGALGELLIMGDGVGRGYIGREDLNEKSFIRLLDMPAYRSGDLVRIRENGDIEYHGRMDNQVKLRGLRVELGEIESVMGSYPGIKSSIVIVVKKETEYLAAYFTADKEIDIEDLKVHLGEHLTAYMVPQAFMQLSEMPLTANGKIDKKALPEPGMEKEEVVLPENDRQQAILDMVKEIIGDVPLGITTDIFAAGLSSLGCIRLCTMLTNKFGVDITLAQLFENKTVRDIENLLDSGKDREEYELRSEYPLSMTQMGIFVETVHFKDSTVYNIPSLYELDGEIDMDRLRLAIEKTLNAHPYLSMTLSRNEEGDVYAVRSQEIKAEISEGDRLPSPEELVRPFDLTTDGPLCRIGLYTADTGKYLFIDTHHIISDGESLNVLMEDIDRAYKGEEIEPETFTGFEAALSEERARTSGRLDKAREWYDGVYGKGAKVSLPPKDIVDNPADEGSFILTGGISAERIRAFCEENHLGLNAFFTTATGLALKVFTGDERAVFASIYNGRNDSRLGRSIGMFVKTLPVCIGPSQKTKVAAAIDECQKLLVNEMAYDIFSFAEICTTYGLNSDVLFAYQGDLSGDDTILIGGKEAKEKELETGDNTARSPFGLDIYLKDNMVCYEFEYDTSMYKRSTMEDFFRLTELIVKGFLTESTIGDILGLSEIKEFSAKAALRKKEEKPDAAEGKADTGSKPVVIGGPRQAKVLNDLILDVFRKVLKKEDLGPDDDFFANGGSSLLAAKVMMAVMVKDYPIEFQDIFNEPTAGALSAHIYHKLTEHWHEEEQPGKAGAEESSIKAPAKEYEKALSHNTPEYLDDIRSESLGRVLLTGPTGFLGIHVLKELMNSDVPKVYCLLRKSRISAESRLRQTFFYYFDDFDDEWLKNRIVVIDGDITDKECIDGLSRFDFDTVINCAASVKHFAELDFLKNVNVNGVANLIDLCLKKKARLVHISTVSVCGERNVDSKGEDTLTENAIDIGQDVESNAYVYSKYLAEKLVLDAIEEKNLDAKIIRMGNLTARYKDGEFQINFKTNNFMNTLKAYVALGCFPVQEMDEMDEFSPIDEVAKATVLLSGTNREFTVFHAYNSHLVEMGDLVQALNDNDLKVDVVHEREYNDRLKAALADESINSSVSPLVNYKTDHDESIVENDVDNAFTIKALYRLGFHWHITDMDYIDSVILMLKTLGFFEY